MERHHLYTLALAAAALAANVASLKTWGDATSPQFVAGAMLGIAAVLKGMYQDSPNEDK
jgi:hypothetical protein